MEWMEKMFRIKCRNVLSMLVFWGQIQNYMMRVSLNLIVLAMVKTEKQASTSDKVIGGERCVVERTGGLNKTAGAQETSGEFEWDQLMIGLVLSSFSWGYLTTQIIGGRLSEMFGFKRIYGIGLFIPALLMFLHPVAARIDFKLFLALRVLVGVFEGVTWPSMHALTARWVPVEERSSWVSQTYFGSTFGMVFTFPMCGFIISAFGWEPCFYIIGCISLLWSFVWYFLAYDRPQDHPRISPEELDEVSSLQVVSSSTKPAVPWLEIIKSPPIWGTLITDCANTFGLITLAGFGPSYMKFMLGLDIKTNGILSGLPMLSRYIGGVAIARLSDWLIKSGRISLLNARRLFNTSSQIAPGVAMVVMGYVGCSPAAAVICMVVGMGLNAIAAGHFVSAVDLAPNFAGTLLGISNTFSGGGMGSLAPIVVGAMTSNNHTWAAWQSVFWLAGAIYTVGAIVYAVTVRVEPQPWNEVKSSKDDVEQEHLEVDQ